ncbi:MAG: amino acid racemase [Hydrogenophilaceae bacterium]|jgi:aspartate racemase|nr:amino acid racemase [Hydrogenophilaceae bacterium]
MTKTIGIIGGLGPAATADFFQKLIAATPARGDSDHLRVLIDSNPRIPDRNAAIAGRGESPAPYLVAAALGLERAGADLLVMACNTAHHWQDDVRAAVAIPFLSMIDETADAAAASGAATIAILAADGARGAQLYERALEQRGRAWLRLDEKAQREFMDLIYAVKAGDRSEPIRAAMRAHAHALIASGADALIAGCTEIPLVLDAPDVSVPLIESTDVLVRRVIARARA